ncbi:cytochrome C assembly family protein [Sandaracinus amylolyticus]|uniref:cytochrome C assembly family protein n=1 Tax=Sandaracinus amylolyticus TaxID=927083 RepID=UPI001F43C901|nr:cytochrome c biogenesis protein CcsA [Sandaracinus amylolyticus]UJR78476.1 HemX protein, negative effector of steady-state concentration of glutamyl-tRNA reductase [Sandaracinus amylolyticus]
MTLTILFAITAVLYLLAGSLYLAFLARDGQQLARGGTAVLGVAVVSHLAFLTVDFVAAGNVPIADIHQALAVASLLVVLGYLATVRGKPRLLVLGAFITPVTLLLFLGAGFRRGVAVVGEGMRSAILPIHVVSNVLGLVGFALAFAAALAYVIQERQLRRKNLGGLYQRLPPLDVLDQLSFRLVVVGFLFFTGGVITGTFWAVRIDPSAPTIGATQTIGVLAWLLFAGVLLLRVAVGWRGRRAAIGTMLGFLCACAVLVGYVVRGDGG